MFAVIKTGGKQYKVAKDDTLVVERLAADAGETVQFNDVLMIGGDTATFGDPMVSGAAVQAEVLEQGRGAKVYNFKKRRRKHSSKRLKGHRQYLTTVKVTEILASGADATGVKAAIGSGSADVAPALSTATPAAKAKAPKVDSPKTEAPEAETPKVKVAKEKAPEPEAVQTEGVRPGNLLEAAQGEADDLTKISGVGPKLLEKLNSNGVFHFWQIAEWGPAEIAFMDDQLSFKGRIERDDWIGQATKLAKENDA